MFLTGTHRVGSLLLMNNSTGMIKQGLDRWYGLRLESSHAGDFTGYEKSHKWNHTHCIQEDIQIR